MQQDLRQAVERLGLDGTASLSVAAIKEAWRTAALAAHPDKGGSVESFLAAQEAYELLMRRRSATADLQRRSRRSPSATEPSPHRRSAPPKQSSTPVPPSSSAAEEPSPPTPTLFFSTRTRWHLVYHTDRRCDALRNAKQVFEERTRPRDLEPCSRCVHRR